MHNIFCCLLIIVNQCNFRGNYIYKNNAIAEENAIIDIAFFEEYYMDKLMFWGWYGISSEMHQIPDGNNSRGIRLRKSNIQIGLENRLDEFHKEEHGNRYFVGEVYAINNELIPNARRDFFIDNVESSQFSKQLRDLFHKQLYTLYYDFSKKNAALKTFQELKNLNKKLEDKAIDIKSKEKLVEDREKVEKKIVNAKKTLTSLENKYRDQTLGNIIKSVDFDTNHHDVNTQKQPRKNNNQNIIKKSLSQQEEAILKRVYCILRKNLIKSTVDELIKKIEEEIKQ